MTRAVVLGGGGPVGIGWEAGLLVGLREGGVDASQADAFIGTSAGSVVGCTLAAGDDLAERVAQLPSGQDDEVPPSDADAMLQLLFSSVAEASRRPEEADAIRARLGQMAIDAPTIDEASWLSLFEMFAGAEWPRGFACTAVDAGTGRFRVWDGDAGVDVQHAVASSCAVPGIFPPVTIGATRWMDGGVRDILNADVAAGHQTVLVISCTLLEVPPELLPPGMGDLFAATRAGLEGLERDGSKVELVVPSQEMLEISGYGMHLMDFTRSAAAFAAGVRQGQLEASRLSAFWEG